MTLKRLLCVMLACLMACGMCTTAVAASESAALDENCVEANCLRYALKSDGTAECLGPADMTSPWNLKIAPSIAKDGVTHIVTSIADGAFRSTDQNNFSKIKSIEFPDSLKKIGDSAFFGTGLTGAVLPEGLESLGTVAFCNCAQLESVSIPGSVRSIPDNAFMNCTNLVSVTLGDGLERIQSNAFGGCTALGSADIPATIEAIGPGAFGSSANPFVVEFAGTPAQWAQATGNKSYWYNGTGTAHVICQIPDELILSQDLEYVPEAEEWLGTVQLDMQGLGEGWTAELQQLRRGLAIWTARSAESVHEFVMPITGAEGDKPKAKICVQNTVSKDVRITAEREISFTVGWSPQNWRTWITLDDHEPRNGDEIEITLSPKDGYVDAEIVEQDGLSVDGGKVVLSSTGDAGYPRSVKIKATVSGIPGDRIPIIVEGQFRHSLGHGEYRAILDDIVIGEDPTPVQPPEEDDGEAAKNPDGDHQDDPPEQPGDDGQGKTPEDPADNASTAPGGSADEGTSSDQNDSHTQPSMEPGQDGSGPTKKPAPDDKDTPTDSPAKPSHGEDSASTDKPSEPSRPPAPSPSPSPSPTQPGKEDREDREDREDGDHDSGSDIEPVPDELPKLKDSALLLLGYNNGKACYVGSLDDSGQPLIYVGDALGFFDLPDGVTVEIVDHDGAPVTRDKPLATGYEAVFRNGAREIIARVPIVIMADVCGTGTISLTQVVRVAKCFTGQQRLTGCYLQAGDFDRNQKVDLTDVVKEAKIFTCRLAGKSGRR